MKLSITRAAAAVVSVLAFGTLAHAQATRTFVSGVGDDVNPCSRTAPCKTFAGAISKTAVGGEINVLDSAGYGAVTITKSITIDGGPFHAGILAGGATGVIINAAGIRVVLRNLDFEGHGTTPGSRGIRVLNAASVLVENVTIQKFVTAPAQAIEINSSAPVRVVLRNITIDGTGVAGSGLTVQGQVASVHVHDVNFQDLSGNSINFAPASAGGMLYVDGVFQRNTAGISAQNGRISINQLRAEGNVKGVLIGANALATVNGSQIIGNGEGIAATAASSIVNIENTVISQNMWGISASGGSTFRVSNSAILSNSVEGMYNSGSFIVSMGGNSLQGNAAPGSFTATVSKQ